MRISSLTVWKCPQLFKSVLTTEDSCKHVIRVRRIIFDTGGKSTVKLNSVPNLAWSLECCCDWPAIDISVLFILTLKSAGNIDRVREVECENLSVG